MRRTVFLIDMNAFFISCEMTRNPDLVGKPAAVAGDPKKRAGIILAASYEARQFGVRTTLPVHQALNLCPQLTLVPPDHYFYEQKSREVMQCLSGYTPLLEQGSIDEAWLDMTGSETLQGEPSAIARKMMNQIQGELGLWCSIGISENKFLAKMAADFRKPLGITELWLKDVPSMLWPLKIRAMYGIGKQTEEKLNRMNITTIGDLAAMELSDLSREFGQWAFDLHRRAHGLDDAPVTPHVDNEMKSIGRSTTLPQDITDLRQAEQVIMELSEEIGMTARRYDKKGRTVQITLKYNDFKTITRQMSVIPTNLSKDIYKAGAALLAACWNPIRAVRLLGISISGFDHDVVADQLSLFDQCEELSCKEEKLEKALDAIRSKYGSNTLVRASLMKKEKDAP